MQIARRQDGSLIVSDFPYWIGILSGVIAFAIAGRAGWAFSKSRLHGEEMFAAAAGICVCAVIGAAMTKQTRFEFDNRNHRVTWSRRGLLSVKGGTLPFAEVEEVCVDTLRTSPTVFSYRVSLKTSCGLLPLSATYGRGERELCEQVRAAIQDVLSSRKSNE